MTTPSELLTQAADLIRDTAEAAEPGPWGSTDHKDATYFGQNDPVLGPQTTIAGIYHGRREGTGRWIALLNPAVATHLEALLRSAAKTFDKTLAAVQDPTDPRHFIMLPDEVTYAIRLARTLLGLEHEENR